MKVNPKADKILLKFEYIKKTSIIIPTKDGQPANTPDFEVSKLIVAAIGDKVTRVKVGDAVICNTHSYLQPTPMKDHAMVSENDIWAVVDEQE